MNQGHYRICSICSAYMIEHKTLPQWLKCPSCGLCKVEKPMLTLKDYWMGRDEKYKDELTDEIRKNASELLRRVNALLQELKVSNPKVSSGWRPQAVNTNVSGSAKKSAHLSGQAVDLADLDGSLKNLIQNNLNLLSKYDLYMEDPTATISWCHLQIRKTLSGNRVFKP